MHLKPSVQTSLWTLLQQWTPLPEGPNYEKPIPLTEAHFSPKNKNLVFAV